MENAKHTPGPWEKDNQEIRKDNETLASCNIYFKNYKSNARLIAAAPELLEALKDILIRLNRIEENYLTKAETQVIKICKASIAKFEGKQ